MKVCLATVHLKPMFIPLSLLYLKAFLVERRGVAHDDVAMLEFAQGETAEAVADRILAAQPDIVGLSCYLWNTRTLADAARHVKAARPDVLVVMGGPDVGPVGPEVLAREAAVDVIVKSEGEVPFADVVDVSRNGWNLTTVRGLWVRQGGGLVDTGDAPIVRSLDDLPSPHTAAYAAPFERDRRIVCIETQRGCVFTCNFCFYNKDLSIRNRRFDLDRVKDEIRFWLDRDVRELYLMDPIFNLNAARAKDICRFIIEHNHRRTGVHAEIWAEFIDDELAWLMKEAGFTALEVGLQTTDGTALAAVERRLKLEPFVAGIRHLHDHGLHFEIQLIHGLPGETEESFRRSLDFAAALEPGRLAVFPLMVLPGTELWRKARAIDLEFDREPPYLVRRTASMGPDAVARGRAIGLAMDALTGARSLRLLAKEPGLTFSGVIDDWIRWRDARMPGCAEPTQDEALAFVTHVCETHAIPPAFYQAFVRKEF